MKRLYDLSIPIFAITGGIATGKSHVSEIFSKHSLVIDADKIVKGIYQQKETLHFISNTVPRSVENNKIDFKILRKAFFGSKAIKSKIENFIYKRMPQAFLSKLQGEETHLFYDIPLLFEKKMESLFDEIIVVYCQPSEQLRRLQKRDTIDKILAQKMIESQIPILDKVERASIKVNNDLEDNKYQKLEPKIFDIFQKLKRKYEL